MKRLVLVIVTVALLSLSCGPAGHVTRLEVMLASVPAVAASGNVVWFSDMQRIKQLAGLPANPGVNDFINPDMSREEVVRRGELVAGYALSDFSGGVKAVGWADTFGFNFLDTDQEIWVESLPKPNTTRSLFSVMKGRFDADAIINKLTALGYQDRVDAGVSYYSLHADYGFADPITPAVSFLNRIMVRQRDIIAAPADALMFPALETFADARVSLESSSTYDRVARTLDDVLGAALLPPAALAPGASGSSPGASPAFDLAGIAYRVDGRQRSMELVLHYPDGTAAQHIAALEHRLAAAEVTVDTVSPPVKLNDLFDIGPVRAVTYGPDSILKVDLAYRPDTKSEVWSRLVESGQFAFLMEAATL